MKENNQRNERKTRFSLPSIKPSFLGISIVFLILLIISLIFDKTIVYSMQNLKNPILDFIFLYLSIASLYLIVLVPSVFLYLNDKKSLLKLWLTFALTALIMIIIKVIFQRERPFQELDLTIPLSLISSSYALWDFSFPSNHSALSFCSLKFLKGRFFIIWLVIALIMAFSRLYFGLHYLSDVIAGVFIGYSISMLVEKKV